MFTSSTLLHICLLFDKLLGRRRTRSGENSMSFPSKVPPPSSTFPSSLQRVRTGTARLTSEKFIALLLVTHTHAYTRHGIYRIVIVSSICSNVLHLGHVRPHFDDIPRILQTFYQAKHLVRHLFTDHIAKSFPSLELVSSTIPLVCRQT